MIRIRVTLLVAVVLALLVPIALSAAEAPKYDKSTEVSLEGDALYVAEHPSRASWTGIYVIMKYGGTGEIEVHLAPASYLANAGVEVKMGDTLKVVGSRVPWKTSEIILAREITVNGKTVAIRDADGKPKW